MTSVEVGHIDLTNALKLPLHVVKYSVAHIQFRLTPFLQVQTDFHFGCFVFHSRLRGIREERGKLTGDIPAWWPWTTTHKESY